MKQGETLYMYGIERKYTFVSYCKENIESKYSQNIKGKTTLKTHIAWYIYIQQFDILASFHLRFNFQKKM